MTKRQSEAPPEALAILPVGFKPLLAFKADIDTLRYPLMVSPKIDGIRAITAGGVILSRNLKPIPNEFIQRSLARLPAGLDGELVVGEPYGADTFQRSSSGIMSVDGSPDFKFFVFDYVMQPSVSYEYRLSVAKRKAAGYHRVQVVPHWFAGSAAQLREMEATSLRKGYEGVMVRSPNGVYKFGRSTARDGILGKVIRKNRDEALIVAYVEEMHNENAATKDALGRTKRSSSKAGKVGKGTLGAFVCLTAEGRKFEIGTGFTAAQRKAFWRDRDDYEGATLTYEYRELTPDGVPRFPVFIGFREDGT